MIPGKRKTDQGPENENEQKHENENVAAAHQEAEKDMDRDADLSIHSPHDDLDEGETARLGKDKTDII